MRNRGLSAVTTGALALTALAVPAGALAAAPLPLKAKDYGSKGYSNHVNVQLVTSANSAKQFIAGVAPIASNFAMGGIYLQCPTAPRSINTVPFAGVPYPAITLKLSHGKYSFSRRFSVNQQIAATTLKGRVRLTVLFTGTVISQGLIKGQVKVSGQKCATTANYSARPTSFPVAPGK